MFGEYRHIAAMKSKHQKLYDLIDSVLLLFQNSGFSYEKSNGTHGY